MPYQTRIRVQKNVFKLLKHTLLSIILRVQTNFKYVLILFDGGVNGVGYYLCPKNVMLTVGSLLDTVY